MCGVNYQLITNQYSLSQIIKTHLIKNVFSKNIVTVQYVPSEYNVANLFTKPLNNEKFFKRNTRLQNVEDSQKTQKMASYFF